MRGSPGAGNRCDLSYFTSPCLKTFLMTHFYSGQSEDMLLLMMLLDMQGVKEDF